MLSRILGGLIQGCAGGIFSLQTKMQSMYLGISIFIYLYVIFPNGWKHCALKPWLHVQFIACNLLQAIM